MSLGYALLNGATQRRFAVAYGVSERRACQVLTLPRASHRYRSVPDEQAASRMRIRDLARARASCGYRRLRVLLQRQGWSVNHKRVDRLLSLMVGQDGRIYFCDRENIRSQVFSQEDEYITMWTDMNRPLDISQDSEGIIYISEQAENGTPPQISVLDG